MNQSANVIYCGKVVGVTFEPTKSTFKACLARFQELGEECIKPQVRLEADPKNKFDKHAVKVLMKNEGDDKEFHIGWLPGPKNGGHNKKVLDVGLDKVKVEVQKANILDGDVKGFDILVSKV